MDLQIRVMSSHLPSLTSFCVLPPSEKPPKGEELPEEEPESAPAEEAPPPSRLDRPPLPKAESGLDEDEESSPPAAELVSAPAAEEELLPSAEPVAEPDPPSPLRSEESPPPLVPEDSAPRPEPVEDPPRPLSPLSPPNPPILLTWPSVLRSFSSTREAALDGSSAGASGEVTGRPEMRAGRVARATARCWKCILFLGVFETGSKFRNEGLESVATCI